MDKRELHNLQFEIEMIGMSVESAFSLSDEMDRTAKFYSEELAATHEINVEELVRKLKFFSNMLNMQVINLSDHMKCSKAAIDSLKK